MSSKYDIWEDKGVYGRCAIIKKLKKDEKHKVYLEQNEKDEDRRQVHMYVPTSLASFELVPAKKSHK